MNIKILLSLLIFGFGIVNVWNSKFVEVETPLSVPNQTQTPDFNGNRFINLPQAQFPGVQRQQIMVIAPKNCTRAEGKRSDALVKELQAQGMPVTRTSSFGFSFVDQEEFAQMQTQANRFAQGNLPLVFVGDRGSANPSASGVIAEYKQSLAR